MKLKIRLLMLLFLMLSGITNAQIRKMSTSVLFESGKYTITQSADSTLRSIIDTLATADSFSLQLIGHTDNVGDSLYNIRLSESRVTAVKDYFTRNGIGENRIKSGAFGYNKPLINNATEEGKSLNRRVEIIVSYRPIPEIDSNDFLPSIQELYKKLETTATSYCIDPTRDTIIRTEKGTIFYIEANTIMVPKKNGSMCVNVMFKDFYNNSDMFLENLTTTADGQMLETQGMFHIEIQDQDGNKLGLRGGKEIVYMMPTDTVMSDAKIWEGTRDHNHRMNWRDDERASRSLNSFNLNRCGFWGGGRDEKCYFFFCKIRRFFSFKKRVSNTRSTRSFLNSRALSFDCNLLNEFFNSFGSQNMTEAVYGQLLDSLGLENMEQLNEYLKTKKIDDIKLRLHNNKDVSFNELNYYVFSSSKLGWKNIDLFAKMPADQKVTLKTDLVASKNVDCKGVFIKRRSILPMYSKNIFSNFHIAGVPRGETVWVIAIRLEKDGKIGLFMEKSKISTDRVKVTWEWVDAAELKDRMKVLDEIVD